MKKYHGDRAITDRAITDIDGTKSAIGLDDFTSFWEHVFPDGRHLGLKGLSSLGDATVGWATGFSIGAVIGSHTAE